MEISSHAKKQNYFLVYIKLNAYYVLWYFDIQIFNNFIQVNLVIYHNTVLCVGNRTPPPRMSSGVDIIWARALDRMRIAAVRKRDVICATAREVFPLPPLGWSWYLVKLCKESNEQLVISLNNHLHTMITFPQILKEGFFFFNFAKSFVITC